MPHPNELSLKGIVDANGKLVCEELRERPVGKIEDVAVAHLEQVFDQAAVDRTNGGRGRHSVARGDITNGHTLTTVTTCSSPRKSSGLRV